jgi:hypothetical protein
MSSAAVVSRSGNRRKSLKQPRTQLGNGRFEWLDEASIVDVERFQIAANGTTNHGDAFVPCKELANLRFGSNALLQVLPRLTFRRPLRSIAQDG